MSNFGSINLPISGKNYSIYIEDRGDHFAIIIKKKFFYWERKIEEITFSIDKAHQIIDFISGEENNKAFSEPEPKFFS